SLRLWRDRLVPRRAFAGRADAQDGADGDHDLWPRRRRGLDAVLSRNLARQGRAANADLGALPRGLADRCGPCQHHRRAEGLANCGFFTIRHSLFAPFHTAAFCFSAIYARQPPNEEISRAPSAPAASTMNPLTPRPSERAMVPIDSGGGIAATN